MKLSKHFTLAELTRSPMADRLDIDNSKPSELVVDNLVTLCNMVLEPCRDKFGPIRPSSGYRCLKLNRAIGSKDSSQHVLGEAVDFEVAGVSNVELAKWIRDNVTFDQLILEFYDPEKGPNSGWCHVSYSRRNRNQVLTINKNGTFKGLLGE